MPRTTRAPSIRWIAAVVMAVATTACSHHAPPQVAVAPAHAQGHTTAWEDSVVLAKMAADRRSADEQRVAAKRAADAERDALNKMAFFSFDQAVLSDLDRATLDAKVPVLQANPGVRIEVAGNCDDRGSEEYNLALGQRRAAAAKRYLVEHGIDNSRIQIISYGLERPIVKAENEQAWAMNRNDEFVVIAGEVQARGGTD
jgi:peptidoglycan-associated lipoprotein